MQGSSGIHSRFYLIVLSVFYVPVTYLPIKR